LNSVFPGTGSVEFEVAFEAALKSVDELSELFDQNGVHGRPTPEIDASDIRAFELTVDRYNETFEHLRTLGGYLHCLLSTDSRNEAAQACWSVLQKAVARFNALTTRWSAWAGSLDVDTLLISSEVAKEYAFVLRNAQRRSQHLMSQDEEELAAELALSGSTAWAKLYRTLTSQITVEIEGNTVPLSVARARAYDANRDVRRAAFTGELSAWKHWAIPLAAALNGVKGETLALAKRRRWASVMDAVLFECNMDRESLDAMMTAATESFPDFRRYLRAKAKALGQERLAWYDLAAPLPGSGKTWKYDDAVQFIVDQFAAFSPRLASLATRAVNERWIDAEPRSGKQDGAFSAGIRKDESRIFVNFKPSFAGVIGVAHELGHAYHTATLASRPALQRGYPRTLAETASLFCETLIREAVYENADPSERFAILEASLQGTCQTVVDIACRFLFEQRVFEQRAKRELSVDELNNLMLEAQRQTYGDGLDAEALHPFMWAAKPHYYGYTFYNFPYMFGLLFALGLYARYRSHPLTFRTRYDDLLAATGVESCADLARRFRINLHSPKFWRSSLDIIRRHINEFEALAANANPTDR
jgi:pepF/M3 family oligoendopeptidase